MSATATASPFVFVHAGAHGYFRTTEAVDTYGQSYALDWVCTDPFAWDSPRTWQASDSAGRIVGTYPTLTAAAAALA